MLNESFPSSLSAGSVLNILKASDDNTSRIVLGGLLVVLATIFTTILTRKSNGNGDPVLHGPPIFGHFRFFSERYSFVNEGLRKLGSAFQFKVLNHKVLIVSGEKARKEFLNSGSLSFRGGYTVLHGSAPNIDDVGIQTDNANTEDTGWFQKRVVAILRKDRVEKVLPKLFNDIDAYARKWGESGKFDPLDEIYKIVFQLTVRVGACDEIAGSPERLDKLRGLLADTERSTNAATVLLKWWPSKERNLKLNATKGMYQMFKEVVEERRASGRRETDALQVLLDEGCSDNDVIQFVMTSLFAGVINTGVMSAWMLMYLGTNPEWKAKVTQEVQSFVAKYATGDQSSEDLATRLSQIPPSAWEDEMSATDLCLRETIRIVQVSVFLRRNHGEDMLVDGHKVEHGSFVAYPTADVHHRPDIYPEPMKFDPSRYERKEDRKEPFAFVGWGAGRHPCLGMRFAKLEVKCIVAMFLMQFDYQVVDEAGNFVKEMPEPDRNTLFERTKRPNGKPIYIRYQRDSV